MASRTGLQATLLGAVVVVSMLVGGAVTALVTGDEAHLEAAFDAFQTFVESVHTAVNAGEALYDCHDADLEVVHIVEQPVGLFVQPAQELECQIIRFLGHG